MNGAGHPAQLVSFDGKFAAFEQSVVAHAMHEEMEKLPQLRRTTDIDHVHAQLGQLGRAARRRS